VDSWLAKFAGTNASNIQEIFNQETKHGCRNFRVRLASALGAMLCARKRLPPYCARAWRLGRRLWLVVGLQLLVATATEEPPQSPSAPIEMADLTMK